MVDATASPAAVAVGIIDDQTPPGGDGRRPGPSFDLGGATRGLTSPFAWLIGGLGGGLLLLFLFRRSRRDHEGPNGLVLAGIGSPGPLMGGSRARAATPVAEVTTASVAVADAAVAPAKRRARPKAAAAALPVPDVAEPAAGAAEVADDDAVIDEDRPLAHARQAARTAPSAPAADLPTPEPPIDDATGAFAAAVAARQPKRKRGKEPSAQAPADAPGAPAAMSAAAATSTPAAAATAARTFSKAAGKGVERARITYRQVRVSSEPDLVQSVELGRLDRGDEVELIESFEGFLRVRTPDGITGWVVRHTIA